MMYQVRATDCKIINQCTIKFGYTWMVTDFKSMRSENRKNRCPFSVIPAAGTIDPGKTSVFKIQFSPEEVDDFSAVLVCDIPCLAENLFPKVSVVGLSRRPLCHIQTDPSDYLNGKNRPAEFKDPLPSSMKVIEILTNKLNNVVTKFFDVINPTANSYEVIWLCENENASPSIKCDQARILVSSGKKCPVSFSFNPTTFKTVEAIWNFTIPVHNVNIPILFVGRVVT